MAGLPQDNNKSIDRFTHWRDADHLAGEESGLLAFMQRIYKTDIDAAEPRDAEEMFEMMKALNIDPVEAEFQYRRLYYHMQANCASCNAKQRCRDDLACSKAAQRFVDYCENHQLLNEMRANPDTILDHS